MWEETFSKTPKNAKRRTNTYVNIKVFRGTVDFSCRGEILGQMFEGKTGRMHIAGEFDHKVALVAFEGPALAYSYVRLTKTQGCKFQEKNVGIE